MIVMRVLPKKKHELELNLLKGSKEGPKKFFLVLTEDNGRLRPHRFRSEEKLWQPKAAQKMLRENRIYLSKDDRTLELGKRLEEMLSFLGVRFFWVDLCRFCFFENRITPMTQDFYLSRGEKICYRCAEGEIKKEAAFRNIKFPIRPLLLRLRSVERVARLIEGKLDLSPENTKFDEMPAHIEKTVMSISQLPIPEMQKDILEKEGIEKLMPVQILAIRSGLLDGRNLLIVSATASGKTLIGEFAGIRAVLQKKKFLFLVPLVALANQKYENMKRRYPFRVSIRVGMSRIKSREELVVPDTGIDADIVVGTYEGIDFILRSGGNIGEVGCIVIDEIHTMADHERGGRLDNLVARLRCLYPSSQFIFLSATMGNPEAIASEMGVEVVIYDRRPIPLERHLAIIPQKKEAIKEIVREEWGNVSRFGYRGQSLIFTHSRRKCEYIANFLLTKRIKAEAYHAGLPYMQRKRIEGDFWNQKICAIVTTAALSAGVDFPASCVIFESMGMGINPLSVSEFHQMLGRAGRPNFHERGKVYLLVDPQTSHSEQREDEIAYNLLKDKMEDLEMEVDEEGEIECALSCFASNLDIKSVNKYGLWTLDETLEKKLEKLGFVQNGRITQFGRAVCMSFLLPKEASFIRKWVLEGEDLMSAVVRLLPFENIYLTHRLKTLLKLKADKLFSGSVLDVFYEPKNYVGLLPTSLWDKLLRLQTDFFACGCKDSPYCDCAMRSISNRIIELRINGFSPSQISRHFVKNYSMMAYGGDLFSYLDEVVHKLEAFERVALVYEKHDVFNRAQKLKKEIEG